MDLPVLGCMGGPLTAGPPSGQFSSAPWAGAAASEEQFIRGQWTLSCRIVGRPGDTLPMLMELSRRMKHRPRTSHPSVRFAIITATLGGAWLCPPLPAAPPEPRCRLHRSLWATCPQVLLPCNKAGHGAHVHFGFNMPQEGSRGLGSRPGSPRGGPPLFSTGGKQPSAGRLGIFTASF